MPNAPRTAAIFDYDGTLIAGYSILAFLKERVRQRELGAADFLRTAVSVAQSALAGKEPWRVRMMKARVLTGLPRPDAPA